MQIANQSIEVALEIESNGHRDQIRPYVCDLERSLLAGFCLESRAYRPV